MRAASGALGAGRIPTTYWVLWCVPLEMRIKLGGGAGGGKDETNSAAASLLSMLEIDKGRPDNADAPGGRAVGRAGCLADGSVRLAEPVSRAIGI